MAYFEQIAVPAATATASTTAAFTGSGYGNARAMRVQLEVTAASGTTPTLDVVVEDTLDGVNWNTVGTFTQKTIASREVINVTALFAERLRARATVGGTTPSFTFSVRAAVFPVT